MRGSKPITAPAFLRALALLAAVASLHPLDAAAQAVPPPRYAVDRWTTDDGLPSNYIRDLAQTGDGYLWMVSSSHVVRFDGVDFTAFRPGNEPGLPPGIPLGVAAGRGDTLWLVQRPQQSGGTTGSLVAWSHGGFSPAGQGGDGAWRGIVQDPGGRLWIYSTDRLWERTEQGFDSILPSGLYTIGWGNAELRPQLFAGGSGVLWLHGAGVGSGRLRDGSFEVVAAGDPGLLVTRPSRGEVLFTRERDGVVEVYDGRSRVLASFRPRADRIPRLIDRKGRLWVTCADGVEVYERGNPEPATSLTLLPTIGVNRVLEDREGDIWLAANTEGLYRIQELPSGPGP